LSLTPSSVPCLNGATGVGCRLSDLVGNDVRTIDCPAAVISLRCEDMIVTPLLFPPVRDDEVCGDCMAQSRVRFLPCVPNWAESAATLVPTGKGFRNLLGWASTPFVELRRMQSEISRLFSGFTPTTRDFPPINIWLGDSSVVVTSELPGVTRGDVTINLRDDALTLEGARRPRGEQNANWQRQERTNGSFAYRPTAVPGRCR
jgi:HSP20 family molecular chaperone IbpA